jgi:hypothetical protein
VLSFFRSKNPLHFIFIVALSLVVMYQWILNPVLPNIVGNQNYIQANIINGIKKFHTTNPITYALLSWLSILLAALLFNKEFNKLKLVSRSNSLPAVSFIIIFLVNKHWWGIHLHFLLLVLIMYIIFKSLEFANLNKPKSTIFNLGVLVGFAGILWFPSHFFAIIIFAGLIRFRAFNIKEWIMVVLGILTPYYLIISFLYLTNQGIFIKDFIPKFTAFKIPEALKTIGWWIRFAWLMLVAFMGLIVVANNNNRQVMQVRKGWGLLLFYFVVTGTLLLANFNNLDIMSVVAIVPITALHAALYIIPQKTRWLNLVFFLSFVLLILQLFKFKYLN